VTRQHYGSLGAIIVGFVLTRLLGVPLVRALGSLTGHHRGAGVLLGAAITVVPFAALAAFTALRLLRPERLASRGVKAVLVGAWFVAGLVMGLLPWSRMGVQIHLRNQEAHLVPGLLHGIDVTVVVGLFLTVGLLLVALRARHEPPTAPLEWVEHQFEDDR
jgi:uncharacterized membrane protein